MCVLLIYIWGTRSFGFGVRKGGLKKSFSFGSPLNHPFWCDLAPMPGHHDSTHADTMQTPCKICGNFPIDSLVCVATNNIISLARELFGQCVES
jgi:hypothetical protein